MAQGRKVTAKKSRKNPVNEPPKGGSNKGDPKSNPQKSARNTGKSSQADASDSTRWTFFSNHAHVLICLYQDSQMVLRDIASKVGITERAVQRIIQDLENAGHVQRERVGRCNHYHVIHDKYLRHPIEEHCTVDMLFEVILNSSAAS